VGHFLQHWNSSGEMPFEMPSRTHAALGENQTWIWAAHCLNHYANSCSLSNS